jgi:hypothetical protein
VSPAGFSGRLNISVNNEPENRSSGGPFEFNLGYGPGITIVESKFMRLAMEPLRLLEKCVEVAGLCREPNRLAKKWNQPMGVAVLIDVFEIGSLASQGSRGKESNGDGTHLHKHCTRQSGCETFFV